MLTMILLVAFFNYILDPYWCFSHNNFFTKKQKGFDERQQKTNRITFQKYKYDALLIGDSMVSFINQNDFGELKVYNYGLSGGRLSEYGDYIKYSKNRNSSDFKYIFLGINLSSNFDERQLPFQKPEIYVNKSNSFLYRYRILFEGYTLKQSIKNLRAILGDTGDDYYDRNNIRFFKNLSKEETKVIFKMVLSDPLKYDKTDRDEVINALQQIKLNNPKSKIVAFIPPRSSLFFKERYLKAEGMARYEKLLRDCISVLGCLYTFMYPNSVTLVTENFYDLGHFYPRVGKMIAHRIAGIEDKNLPLDFGILLDKKNIDRHIADLQYLIQTVPVSSPFM